MSTEPAKDGAAASSEEAEAKVDPIVNLKAEFSRKFESVNNALAAQNQQLQAQLSQILSTMTAKQTESAGGQEKLSDLIYNDPEKAASIIEQNVSTKAANTAVAAVADYQARQSALANLATQYPELSDSSSELSKKAVETYNALPARLKDTAEGYRMAIRDAAADLGILTASKREKKNDSSNDDFTVGGNNAARKSPVKSREGELSNSTLEIAKLMGLNTEDPKVMARLKERAKRTNYKKYE